MNTRTQRAYELAGAAFILCRTEGAVQRDEFSKDVALLWVQRAGMLSARVFTKGVRVCVEVWGATRVLAVSRDTGAPDCEVEQYQRGEWEANLLRLALEGAKQRDGATVH